MTLLQLRINEQVELLGDITPIAGLQAFNRKVEELDEIGLPYVVKLELEDGSVLTEENEYLTQDMDEEDVEQFLDLFHSHHEVVGLSDSQVDKLLKDSIEAALAKLEDDASVTWKEVLFSIIDLDDPEQLEWLKQGWG